MPRTAALIVVSAALLAIVAFGVRERVPSTLGALELVGAGVVELGASIIRDAFGRTVGIVERAAEQSALAAKGSSTEPSGSWPIGRESYLGLSSGVPVVPDEGRADSLPVAAPTALVSSRADRPTYPGQTRLLLGTGCCARAWWSEDSKSLRYIDRPPESPATALYEVPVWPPGSEPSVVDANAGHPAGATRLTVRTAGDHSIIQDLTTGDEWPLPTGGGAVRLSSDGSRAVWWAAHGGRLGVDALIRVYASDIHGSEVKELIALWGTTVVSFLPDNRRVLILGRPLKDSALSVLVAVDVESNALFELARGEWLTDAAPSPDGRWVAYMVSLDREHPERNGVWVAPIEDGGREVARRLEAEGSYRWRSGGRLVYMPLEFSGGPQTVWEFDPNNGSTRRLLGPETQLRVAEDDWSVSPDGATIAYLDRAERSLWVVDLP